MANRIITKDVSDNIIAGAVLANEFLMSGAAGMVLAHDTDNTRVVVNKNSNLIPLNIGSLWWFLIDTATDVDLDVDMDTGTKAPTTQYYVYAVTNGTTISFKISLSSSYPSGYTASNSRQLGKFMTDGSSNVSSSTISTTIKISALDGSLLSGGTTAAVVEFWGIKDLRLIKAKVGDNTRVQVNPDARNIPLNIGAYFFIMTTVVDVDGVDDLDTGTQAAGTDYYVYACTNGSTLTFKVSANATVPTGFDAAHSRKIGGFHTLCTAVGTIGGHTLTGYLQKDILPASVWCLKHRAKNLVNVGMVYDSKSQKWVDIYLASGTGVSTTSVNGGTISDTRTWLDFVDDGGAVGKRLPTDSEFQLFAAGSNEETNITDSADPGTTGGHSDTASRRMISNIGCEDCCGAMYQWLLDQSYYPGTPGWVDLPGSKGSLYTGGDVKLVAGGLWSDATDCGSRCRSASYYRWFMYTNCGARFVAEPL